MLGWIMFIAERLGAYILRFSGFVPSLQIRAINSRDEWAIIDGMHGRGRTPRPHVVHHNIQYLTEFVPAW